MKKYCVDVHWDVARSFEVEADSREDAEEKMWNLISHGGIDVWKDGFEATDDVNIECSGEENGNGEIEFY